MSAFQDKTNSNSHLLSTIYYTEVPNTQDYLLICFIILTGIHWILISDKINAMYDITLLVQYFKIILKLVLLQCYNSFPISLKITLW